MNIRRRILEKQRPAALLLLCLVPAMGNAGDIKFSLQGGYLNFSDTVIGETYGNGWVYNPSLAVSLSPYVDLRAAYEGGYRQEAEIGLFREPSTLTLNAWEASAVLRYPGFRPWEVFLEAGLGSYGYTQDIQSEFIRKKADQRKTAAFAAAGITYIAGRNVFLTARIKYVSLKVRPFDIEVDLTGYRLLAGAGYRFSF